MCWKKMELGTGFQLPPDTMGLVVHIVKDPVTGFSETLIRDCTRLLIGENNLLSMAYALEILHEPEPLNFGLEGR
jgi:hypothetical protein